MTDGPTGKRDALAAEQEHLDRVHARVDALRARARARSESAAASPRGGTFQATFERDVTAHHHAARAARLTFGDVEGLAFGRLDLADADTLHIGRVSVIDEDGEVLLVDWRAPAAGAFYRATAAHPEGVARRRTLTTRGDRVVDLDDELLDVEAADRLGLEPVTGQGALLAALQRARTGHMRDVAATIQADQDAIIRAPATGTLIVAGGPGTGKTVVALHRVASLLYRDRARFEGRGVLIVGPSDAFTEHTSRVLPSLGEDRAVQRSIGQLAPAGAQVQGWDAPDVAEIKGDESMVELARQLVLQAPPDLPPSTRVSFDGTTVRVDAATLTPVRRRLLERLDVDREGATYHQRAAAAEEALRQSLFRAWRRAHRDSGANPPRERAGSGFDAALDDQPQITMLRRCWWPTLAPVAVVAALVRGETDLDQVGSHLPEQRRARLRAAWDAATGWTVDDVGLLDEVDAWLGPGPSDDAPERTSDGDGGIRLTADRFRVERPRVDVTDPSYRDFAHVVVDEAQDLSPMLWRAVARRGPYASWTVVGDLAQRSRTAEPSTWDAVAATLGRRQVDVRWLRVNYRTPREVTGLARAVLADAGLDPDVVPTSVRDGGELPTLVRADDVVAATVTRVVAGLSAHEGTVAAIVADDRLEQVRDALAAHPLDPHDREHRLRILDPRTAKGLEFDQVVVAHPERIVAASEVGHHQLYVAVTRATRSLTLVAPPTAVVPGQERTEQVRG